jgi:hypothetical protein
MTIQHLIEDLLLEGESYVLQKKERTAELDELSRSKVGWVDVKELIGIIEKKTNISKGTRGSEDVGTYLGFFEVNFEIPENESSNYRIKHIFPSEPPFTRYFEFVSIDRNLRMDNELHHYEIDLELSKKFD